jgi:hypothetical protein
MIFAVKTLENYQRDKLLLINKLAVGDLSNPSISTQVSCYIYDEIHFVACSLS